MGCFVLGQKRGKKCCLYSVFRFQFVLNVALCFSVESFLLQGRNSKYFFPSHFSVSCIFLVSSFLVSTLVARRSTLDFVVQNQELFLFGLVIGTVITALLLKGIQCYKNHSLCYYLISLVE